MAKTTRQLTNTAKIHRIETALADLLEEVLTCGFYGTASIEFYIQDGVIQRISRKAEQEVT